MSKRRDWRVPGSAISPVPIRPSGRPSLAGGRAAASADIDGHAAPSVVATRRLAENLQRRTSEYRTDATIDLTLIDALLEHDGPEAARDALDGHASFLDALLADLHATVAEAAHERDAEEELVAVGTPSLVGRVRAQVVGVAGAAAVLLALVLSGPRTAGTDAVLTSGDQAVYQENLAARPRAAVAKAASSAAAGMRQMRERLMRAPDRARVAVLQRPSGSGQVAAVASSLAPLGEPAAAPSSGGASVAAATSAAGQPPAEQPPAEQPTPVHALPQVPKFSAPQHVGPSPDASGAALDDSIVDAGALAPQTPAAPELDAE